MMLEKHVQRQLTKVVEDPEKGKYAEYVLLVLGGTVKLDSLTVIHFEECIFAAPLPVASLHIGVP